MKIVVLLHDHLHAVSKLHQSAFPYSALTRLGYESVRRYYEWQLTGPHDCLAIGAFEDSGRLLGFCFGGVFRGALSGFLQKNYTFLVLQVLKRPWLIITNPIFRDRLGLGLRVLKRRNTPEEKYREVMERPFGILSIAVDPSAQGKGVGQMLMRYSEEYARQKRFTQMGLSVAVDNEQATKFYLKLGWKKVLYGNSWNGSMLKDL